MAKKGPVHQRTVGWLFWFITFVILLAPSVYGAYQVVNPDEEWPVPIGVGSLMAGMFAGCVAWVVNSILHVHFKRQQAAARKLAKKK